MTRLTLAIFFALVFSVFAQAQLIISDPPFPTKNDEVVITFNSSLGSGGLSGFDGDIYAHTGLITSNSSSGTDWKYVKAGWTENRPDCKMINIGDNLWELTISPSIQEFYDVPDNETILRLAFVFRNEDGSQTGKTDDEGDIFYDVYESGSNIIITIPEISPYIVSIGDNIDIEGSSASIDSTFIYDNGDLIYADTGSSFSTSIVATSSGKHWIIAIGESENEIVKDSIYYYVRNGQNTQELPSGIRDGINYVDENTVILCLLAPDKEHVFVIGDFNDWEINVNSEMKITPDNLRFWIELSDLEDGKEYIFQYLIDGNIRVGDPYCEKVSDPWNDKWINSATYPNLIDYPTNKTTGIASVMQTNQQEYIWQTDDFDVPEDEKLVIYELLVRDFIIKHDFNTMLDTLDYLDRLGVNAIELMPNSEFEGNSSWGYNPNYYFAPDKYYGPKNTFKAFVDECHSRGIAVFMDMVLNHSYGTSPMVKMYWNAEQNRPAPDNPWYNEQSNFTNPDAQWGYDFNHESIYTKQLIDSINSYWMTEYRVDGFRFDFTKGFGNNIKDNNDPWGSNYDADRIALLKRMADKIWEVKDDAAIIFEHLAVNSEERELANYGIKLWGNLNYNYNEATMGYHDNGKSNFDWISYKKRGWNDPHVVGYMESHDEERLMIKNLEFGNSQGNYNIKDLTTALGRQELAANFFLTIPGPKMIWQFGERGYDVSIDFNGRLGEKPPRWEYMNDWRRVKLYHVYAQLIQLKKTEEAFSTSNFSLDLNNAMKKINLTNEDMNVVILGNFGVSEGSINPSFQNAGTWYEYWTGDSIVVTNTNSSIDMEAGEYLIYTTKKLTKPDYVGLSEGEIKDIDLTLFPNPADVMLNILSEKEINKIEIHNITGSIVYNKDNICEKQINIITSDFKPGIYLARIVLINGRTNSRKIIIK